MHVGIEATAWDMQRGFGRHLRSLVGALWSLKPRHRFTLFSAVPGWSGLPENVRTTQVPAGRSFRELCGLSRALSDPKLDVLLFPSVHSFVPTWSRARKLVILHDVTADLYPGLAFGTWRDRLLWRIKTRWAIWQAHRLLTVSEHSRQGLRRKWGDRDIEVLGEASDPIFQPRSLPGPSPLLVGRGVPKGRRLVVYVGGFAPFKNLSRLLDAFGRIAAKPQFRDVHLILVGEDRKEVFHSEVEALRQKIQAQCLGHRVCFTGFLADSDLVELLNLSVVLTLPSLNEGFGLPAVEAAACGCPVVATRESPLPELLGSGGIFVDPYSPAELQAALERVLSDRDLRDRMSRAALAQAGQLRWETAAHRLLAVLEAS